MDAITEHVNLVTVNVFSISFIDKYFCCLKIATIQLKLNSWVIYNYQIMGYKIFNHANLSWMRSFCCNRNIFLAYYLPARDVFCLLPLPTVRTFSIDYFSTKTFLNVFHATDFVPKPFKTSENLLLSDVFKGIKGDPWHKWQWWMQPG